MIKKKKENRRTKVTGFFIKEWPYTGFLLSDKLSSVINNIHFFTLFPTTLMHYSVLRRLVI